jgi:hypothetical protein
MDGVIDAPGSAQELVIDFMYLDLETCTRCRGTQANLEAALSEVGRVLEVAGVDVAVHKMFVTSAEQARAAGFVSSPTIRVNGQDIAFELRESNCGECGDLCACDGSVDCRVWVWRGQEYTEAPTAMIVDAILREVYGGVEHPAAAAPPAALPENLERFFAGKERLAAESTSCCAPAKQASCCEPSEKASCCGEASSGGCGCQS